MQYLVNFVFLFAVCGAQNKCPSDTNDPVSPGLEIVWECSNFPADDPFGGCDWAYSHLHHGEGNIAGVDDPDSNRDGDVLRVFYPEGSESSQPGDEKGGVQFYSYPFSPVDEAYFEYDLFFDSTFEFVQGGKLPGFFGGEGSCAGCPDDPDSPCFSTRYMWRESGDLELYTYMPAMRSVCSDEDECEFCDCDLTVCDFRCAHSLGRGSYRFDTNRWYNVRQYVKLNDPDSTNAEMEIWVDDEAVYRITDIKFRETSEVMIDSIYFSTFFGGTGADWGSAADTYIYFDNFKVYA